jgi:hypothetical protein
MKLFQIQMVVALRLRQFGAAYCGLLDGGQQEAAEQGRVVLPDPAVAEVHDEILPAVHDAAQVEGVLRRTGRDRQQLANDVQPSARR